MSQKTTPVGTEGHKTKGAGAKTKGHSRLAQKTAIVTEAELRRQQTISPEDVMRLDKATEGINRYKLTKGRGRGPRGSCAKVSLYISQVTCVHLRLMCTRLTL